MKKIAFVFAVATVTAVPCLYSQNNTIDPWKFIEYKLVTAPNSLSKKGHLLRFIPASLIGALTGVVLNLDNYRSIKYVLRFLTDNYDYKTALASTLSASLVYSFIDIITQQIVDAQAIHAFIIQWPEYKKYTPAQLQPIFDDVYEMYLFDPNSAKYKNNAADALIIAREYIEAHSTEAYGKKSAYNCTKYVAKNILKFAPVKMIVNTIKLFV